MQWGCMEIPCSLLSHSLGSCKHPFHAVHLSVWQPGWLGASAYLCAVGVPMPGGGQQGPLPTWPSLCLCRSPKARTLSVCSGLVVFSVCARVCVCVCISWCCGLCVPVPVWLCYGLYESAPSMCPCGGLCPSLCWCCALGYPRERDDSATAPPINLCLTAPFSPCADSSGGGHRISHLGTDRIPPSQGPSTAVSFPVPPPSPPSNSHSDVGENLPGPLPPCPRTECSSLGPWLSGSPHMPWAWWQEKTGRQGAKGS